MIGVAYCAKPTDEHRVIKHKLNIHVRNFMMRTKFISAPPEELRSLSRTSDGVSTKHSVRIWLAARVRCVSVAH
ncbi:hypothetical protein D3C72_1803760 [compost metagenome]